MSRNVLAEKLGEKLKQVRVSLGFSGVRMAEALGVARVSYYRNELGKNHPGLYTILRLAKKYNISMDWFLCDRGAMIYKEAEPIVAEKLGPGKDKGPLSVDEREIITNIRKIPLLRYELMAYLYKFKEEHPEKFNEPGHAGD